MKSYRQMAENVLRRRDEILEKRKAAKRKRFFVIKYATAVSALCFVAAIGLGIREKTDHNEEFYNFDESSFSQSVETTDTTPSATTTTTVSVPVDQDGGEDSSSPSENTESTAGDDQNEALQPVTGPPKNPLQSGVNKPSSDSPSGRPVGPPDSPVITSPAPLPPYVTVPVSTTVVVTRPAPIFPPYVTVTESTTIVVTDPSPGTVTTSVSQVTSVPSPTEGNEGIHTSVSEVSKVTTKITTKATTRATTRVTTKTTTVHTTKETEGGAEVPQEPCVTTVSRVTVTTLVTSISWVSVVTSAVVPTEPAPTETTSNTTDYEPDSIPDEDIPYAFPKIWFSYRYYYYDSRSTEYYDISGTPVTAQGTDPNTGSTVTRLAYVRKIDDYTIVIRFDGSSTCYIYSG